MDCIRQQRLRQRILHNASLIGASHSAFTPQPSFTLNEVGACLLLTILYVMKNLL
jgi:hypothetical protein